MKNTVSIEKVSVKPFEVKYLTNGFKRYAISIETKKGESMLLILTQFFMKI
jgi:hypothetical protein